MIDEPLNPENDILDTIFIPQLPLDIDWDKGKEAGKWLDDYIDYARSVSPMTPDSYHESAALWLGSVAIARRLVLEMSYDNVYPNLYFLWLAKTTLYHKSTALNIPRKIASETFPFLMAAQDTTPEAFLSDMAGNQPINYNTLRLDDQKTWDKERNFAAQKGWVLDEMSGLLAGAGRDYNAGQLESLIRFYDCDPIHTRSTQKQGRTIVKNAYLCLLGASTPAAMSAHLASENLWSNGWWPRFAILTPSARPTWKIATGNNRPDNLKSCLLDLFSRLPNDTKWPDAPRQLSINLGEGVFDLWSRYNKAVTNDMLNDDIPDKLYGTYGRLPTQVLKVSMILSAFDWPKTISAPRIELSHLIKAIDIAETWRESTHRAIVAADQDDFSRLSERVLKVIARCEPHGASRRDMYQAMRDRRASEINIAIDELLEAGVIEPLEKEKNNKGGRPTERYVLKRE